MAEKQPATGRGGKYNFPNARMKRLEGNRQRVMNNIQNFEQPFGFSMRLGKIK